MRAHKDFSLVASREKKGGERERDTMSLPAGLVVD